MPEKRRAKRNERKERKERKVRKEKRVESKKLETTEKNEKGKMQNAKCKMLHSDIGTIEKRESNNDIREK